MFESILCQVTEYDPDVLASLIGLAVEIAREGREGRRVGTLFTVGDENAVLARSRPLILGSVVWASRIVTPRRQPQSPRNNQRIGATRRRVRGEPRRNLPFRVPLPRCCGRTSARATGTRQSSHRRCQHDSCLPGARYRVLRAFGGTQFL